MDVKHEFDIKLKVRLDETEEILELVAKQYFTIEQFKDEICRKFKIPKNEQVLVYSNRQLHDKEKFDDLMRQYFLS